MRRLFTIICACLALSTNAKPPRFGRPVVGFITLDGTMAASQGCTTSNSNALSCSSVSFSTAAGGRLCVALTGWNGGGGQQPAPTVSGAGLTWTRVSGVNKWTGSFPGDAGAEIWAAWAPSALSSQVVTITRADAGLSTLSMQLLVRCYSGTVNASSSIYAAFGALEVTQDSWGVASRALNTTLTGTASTSYLVGVWLDGRTNVTLSADTNTTLDSNDNDGAMGFSVATGHRNSSPGGSVSYGTGQSDTYYAVAGIEILAGP